MRKLNAMKVGQNKGSKKIQLRNGNYTLLIIDDCSVEIGSAGGPLTLTSLAIYMCVCGRVGTLTMFSFIHLVVMTQTHFVLLSDDDLWNSDTREYEFKVHGSINT